MPSKSARNGGLGSKSSARNTCVMVNTMANAASISSQAHRRRAQQQPAGPNKIRESDGELAL